MATLNYYLIMPDNSYVACDQVGLNSFGMLQVTGAANPGLSGLNNATFWNRHFADFAGYKAVNIPLQSLDDLVCIISTQANEVEGAGDVAINLTGALGFFKTNGASITADNNWLIPGTFISSGDEFPTDLYALWPNYVKIFNLRRIHAFSGPI